MELLVKSRKNPSIALGFGLSVRSESDSDEAIRV